MILDPILDSPLDSYSLNDDLECQMDSIKPLAVHSKARTPIGCNQMYAGDHAVCQQYFQL